MFLVSFLEKLENDIPWHLVNGLKNITTIYKQVVRPLSRYKPTYITLLTIVTNFHEHPSKMTSKHLKHGETFSLDFPPPKKKTQTSAKKKHQPPSPPEIYMSPEKGTNPEGKASPPNSL